MYGITCDGFPLLDFRDDDLIVLNPKVRLQVNTSGECSFVIYKNHPHYSKLKRLKSVIEVFDDHGVIFRGRATGDSINFDHGMSVDVEGHMACFNDSIVRPFQFPSDFLEDADYIAAAESGNVVEFFLSWLIDNHNTQVQDFQKMKLGNVTVTEPNNYFSRVLTDITSTWEVLKAALFDSALGGYLCIRYEEDGNYIDYLSAFTETNSQEIVFGENLLDLNSQTETIKTYSAIIPIGALGLNINVLPDQVIANDIVKTGDTLYSQSAVDEFGWIYAPVSETTWEEITDEQDLLARGANWLISKGGFLNAMKATAVDLHFSDEQVESIRIYKNVNVRSLPHDVSEQLPLEKLEIDLLNPQNTKITVGKTLMSLTDQTVEIQEEAKKRYSKLTKTDEEIRMEVIDEIDALAASVDVSIGNIEMQVDGVGESVSILNQTVEGLSLEISDVDGNVILIEQTLDGITVTGADGRTLVAGGMIETDTIRLNRLVATDEADSQGKMEINREGLTVYNRNGVARIRLGYTDDSYDYPFIVLGSGDGTSGTTNAGLVKKFWNGLWIGNSAPAQESGEFTPKNGYAGIFVDTTDGAVYVVNDTAMQNVYTGNAIAKFA